MMQKVFQNIRGLATVAVVGPGRAHSVLFGCAAGVLSYVGYYAYRLVRVSCFDTEYYGVQSRQRYAEKQDIFLRENSEDLAAASLANYVAEYDPIATRMPFQKLRSEVMNCDPERLGGRAIVNMELSDNKISI